MRTCKIVSVAGLLLAATAAAQNRVTVHGVAYDSLHARPLHGAFVVLVGTQLTTTSDSAGRFSFESVVPGTYRVAAQHDVIDAIGISAIGATAKVTDGRETLRLYVPSFAQLWRVVCGPTPPLSDTGFVFGTVRPAPGMKSLANVVVSARWVDLVASGRTVGQKLKTLEVNADSTGNYAVCGVPTTTGLSIHAGTDSAESGLFGIDPLDRERVTRRDIQLGTLLSSVIAAGRGATLTGTVVADSGVGAVSNAEVLLEEMGIKATTNDKGEYKLGDILPGTHTLRVRRIGFAETATRVDLQEAENRQRNFTLNKVTVLDSVGVSAKATPRDEALKTFEEHRKLGLGKFLNREELVKAGDRPLASMLSQFNGLQVVRTPGGRTMLVAKRGVKSGLQSVGNACLVMVYLDGVVQNPQPDINEFLPRDLQGIEYFSGAGRIPIEYNRLGAPCGVLVLHTYKG